MDVAPDLAPEVLERAMPGRPVRTYQALLSTDADARAWARGDAPQGAVVVVDYQASPRGRAGLEWQVRPGTDLCFSLIVRPALKPEREGWLYTVATTGISDVVGDDAAIWWPDRIEGSATTVDVGIHAELGPNVVDWGIVNVLWPEARDRPALLAELVAAIETRLAATCENVLPDHLARCRTIGRHVRARLIPMGPGGPEVTGKAVGALMDGALLLETAKGSRVVVRPQNLGLLEEVPEPQVVDDASAD